MLNSIIATCTTNLGIRLLVLASFLASLIQTGIEWHDLNEVFKMIRENKMDLDINPVQFRTSLGFTVILFGAALAVISPRLSKIALVLMTCVFAFYWVMLFFNDSHKLSWPFRSGRFGFERNFTFVSYEAAPLIALLVGYWAWFKRYEYRAITVTGVICVAFQFFVWFVDTRLMANSEAAGTSYQYPPITINATFIGASLGHVILLLFCIITIIAFGVAMNRDARNKEFKFL